MRLNIFVLACCVAFASLPRSLNASRIETMLAKVDAKQGSLANRLNDSVLQATPDINWAQQVSSAPTAIDILANIFMLAAKSIDFQLARPDSGHFEYLKFYNFKSALHSISNAGWDAFATADSSMDGIMQRTADMPHNLKQALKVLITTDVKTFKRMGRVYLDSVSNSVSKCKQLAQEAADEFRHMGKVIEEVVLGSTKTQHQASINATRLQIEKDSQEAVKAQLASHKKNLEERIKQTKKDVNEWKERHIKALDDLPSGWDMIGMNFAEGWAKIASFGAYGGYSGVDGNDNDDGGDNSNSAPKKGFQSCIDPNTPGEVSVDEIIFLAPLKPLQGTLSKAIEQFQSTIDGGSKDLKKTEEDYRQFDLFMNAFIDAVNNKEVKPNNKAALLSVLKPLKKIGEDAWAAANAGKGVGKYPEFKKKLSEYQDEAACISTLVSSGSGSPIYKKNKSKKKSGSNSQSAVAQHVINARLKVSEATHQLDKLEERREKQAEQALKTEEKLAKIVANLKRTTAKAKTNEQVIEVLKVALALLVDLQKNWRKLTMFFIKMETRINNTFGPRVDNVLKIFEATEQSAGQIVPVIGEMLFDDIMKSLAECITVHRISKKYLGLSRGHFLPMIEEAAVMIVAEPDKQVKLKTDFERMKRSADSAIRTLINEEKQDFVRQIQRRREEMRDDFAPILNLIPDKIERKIDEATKIGVEATTPIANPEPEVTAVEKLTNDDFHVEDYVSGTVEVKEKAEEELKEEVDSLLGDFDFGRK